MNFAAEIYVDASGSVYGAAKTEQRGSQSVEGRTVCGRPVAYAGRWYGSQMSYSPFRRAVAAAREAATKRSA